MSYAEEDKDLVEPIAVRMQDAGLQVWFDKWEIIGMDHILQKINEGLKGSKRLILFASPHAMKSEWVSWEREAALSRARGDVKNPLIIVLLASCSHKLLQKAYISFDFRTPGAEPWQDLLEACEAPGKRNDDQGLKVDRQRGNSRRSIIEKNREIAPTALLKTIHDGMVLNGEVKTITDYGVIVGLGGLEGLLHITDMSWHRIKHPSDVMSVGDLIKVQVIHFNPDTQRISLGMKQLQTDPWEGIGAKYPPGTRFRGVVTNITDYGAYVELESGVLGLAHVSELSWTKKNLHPSKLLDVGTEVDVMVLYVDADRRQISLGLKQCQDNPWVAFAEKHPIGVTVTGEIENITEFGLFIALEGDISGLVHLSDITCELDAAGDPLKQFQRGQEIKAIVLSVDPEKERISLGMKQVSTENEPEKYVYMETHAREELD